MYEPIPVDIRTSHRHGDFVLLESFHFEHGDLEVRVFAPGSGDTGALRFQDVIGFSMKEDRFAASDRQFHNKATATARARAGLNSFFMKSSNAPVMPALEKTAAGSSGDAANRLEHFRLNLREHELSFVASRNYEIHVEPSGMPN